MENHQEQVASHESPATLHIPVYPEIPEMFVAELGYQLAQRKLKNRKYRPTAQGMRTGMIDLIPGFSRHFVKATVGPNGDIEWPEDDTKVGLVEGSFDYFEDASTTALGLMSNLNPQAMEQVAFRVHRERTGQPDQIAYPPKFTVELGAQLPEGTLNELANWLTSKVVFHSLKGMRLIKEAGYNASFSPQTAITFADIQKFLECQINVRVEDVSESVDHSLDDPGTARATDAESTVSPWDIKNAIDSNTDMFDLDEDKADEVKLIQKAAVRFNSWATQVPDYRDLINENLENTRKRAKDWIDSRARVDASIDAVEVTS